MSVRETILKLLKCPAERVRIIDDAALIEAPRGDAVVIFFAIWSAPCHAALSEISECLNHLSSEPEVWIVDHDVFPGQTDSIFSGMREGWCEVFFFRGGKQVDQLLRIKKEYRAPFLMAWRDSFGSE